MNTRPPRYSSVVTGLLLVLVSAIMFVVQSNEPLRAESRLGNEPTPVTPMEVPAGTVGEYLFNEGGGNAIGDSSGLARHGTNHGATWIPSPIRDTNGEARYALSFDAAYVSVPSDALKHLPLTMSLWAKPAPNLNDRRSNIISNDRPWHSGHGIGVNSSGNLYLEYEDAPGASFRNTGKILEWGKWYHLVAIYEEGRLRTYLNAELVDDFSYVQGQLDAEATFLIGRHNFDSGLGSRAHFQGAIDAVRIYHRALSLDEVQRLYQEGASAPAAVLQSPPVGLSMGPATLQLSATVVNPGTFVIKNVEFVVFYDGVWHSAGVDTAAPYESIWQTPNLLRSQVIRFGVHINSGYEDIIPFSGTLHDVNYYESLGNPHVTENWVPFRAYVNQRPLQPVGDYMCSVASMAMILAMNGFIARDMAVMTETAESLYKVGIALNRDGDAEIGLMTDALLDLGMTAEHYNQDVGEAWQKITEEIDAGRPILLRTNRGSVTRVGHFIVVVGYRDATEGRQVIAYDPYGRWKGTVNDYDENDEDDPFSHKGQWVYYDFRAIFGAMNHFIAAGPPSLAAAATINGVPSTPPDVISDETETHGTYYGVEIFAPELYLPFTRK